MTTFKNRKLYQTALMRRAVGKPLHVNARMDVAAVALVDGQYQVIATTRGVAVMRHGAGYAKDFARATAAIDPDRLVVLAHADRRGAQFWCDEKNRKNSENRPIWRESYRVDFTVKIDDPVSQVAVRQMLEKSEQ